MVDARRAEKILEAKKWRERNKLMRVDFPDKIWAWLNSPAHAAYLRGANSGGKTYALAFLCAMHLLGRYHPRYTGWRPSKPASDTYAVIVWCLSKTSQVLRDALQAHLFGAPGQEGTGLIPKESIVSIQSARGVAGAIDFAIIRRDDGTLAKVSFKSYEVGREALQGERVSLIAADEAFDDTGLLSELLARGAGVDGIFRLTATERLQQSAAIQWFSEGGEDRQTFGFSLDDVTRLSAEEKARIKSSYPPNEVDARYHGLPYRGGGGLFHTSIEDVLIDCDPSQFGPQFRYLISIDPNHFGQSDQASKFAALFWAYDPLRPQEWIIFNEILMRGGVADQVGAILAAGGEGLPIAWPHDGTQGMATGQSLAKLFSNFPGIRMHSHHATLGPGDDGGYNLEDRISLCNKMLAAGQLKIAKQCRNLIAQYQAAEREEETNKPLISKLDLVASMTIGVMMFRIARVAPEYSMTRGNRGPELCIGASDPREWEWLEGPSRPAWEG